MGKVAFVFPGQASQYPGMGKELAEKYPAARAVFEEADKALGFSISKICFAGTEDELKLTANTQPAILTCSVRRQTHHLQWSALPRGQNETAVPEAALDLYANSR